MYVSAVVVFRVFGSKIGHGGVVIQVRGNANHILSIANWFLFRLWIDWLVCPLLEVVQDGVTGGLADGRIEKRGVRSIEG